MSKKSKMRRGERSVLYRLESAWCDLSERKKVLLYVAIYSVIFCIAAGLVFSPFLYQKKSLVGGNDAHYQTWPTVIYVGKWLREVFRGLLQGKLAFKLIDPSLAMGSDVIGTLNFYGFGDPLNVFYAAVPTAYSEYLYAVLAILRLYLAGLSFSYLCRCYKKPYSHTLVGSVVYCFCGYATVSISGWIFFLNPMIQMPLYIVGVEKLLKREKPYLFIFTVFYSALCGFYFVYMMTILTAVYAVVRFFDLYHADRIKMLACSIARTAGAYLLGLGLAAVIFLPAVIAYLSCTRVGGFSVLDVGLVYSKAWYNNEFWMLFAPYGTPHEWDYVSMLPIALFALVPLFGSKRKGRTLKILTIAGLLLLLLPIGGSIMNGFSYPINRWHFGLSLLLAYLVVDTLPALCDLSKRQFKVCLGLAAIYLVLALTAKTDATTRNIVVAAVFVLMTLLVLVMAKPSVREQFFGQGGGRRSFAAALCLVLVVANVGAYGIYEFDEDKADWGSNFPEMGVLSDSLENHDIKQLQPYLEKNPAGRAEFTASSSFRNMGMLFQVPTVPYYFSVSNEYISEFFRNIELPRMRNSFNIHNDDWRTLSSELISVKYFGIWPGAEKHVPYGYSLIEETDEGYLIYENQYALPWGYTYDSAITYDMLDGLNGVQKQEAMLQAVALDETGFQQLDKIAYDEKEIPYEITYKNCSWENGVIKADKENAVITLKFDMPAETDGYLRLEGFYSQKGMDLTVRCAGIKKTIVVDSINYIRGFDHKAYLTDLCYSDEARTELTITLSKAGKYELSAIELYALPMENYPERVEALRAEPLENIEWGTNSLTGTVDLSKDKILCVSVPYSKGWTATVDGEKAEILRGNYMFMCIPLAAGHHDIEFHYCSPGLKLGVCITAASLCIVGGMLILDRKKRVKSREKKIRKQTAER